MNRAKSVFAMAFFALLAIVSIQAVSHLVSGFDLGWLGALFASVPLLLMLIFVMLGKRFPASQSRLTAITVTTAFGTTLAAVDWVLRSGSFAAAGMAGLCFVAYIVYQLWYSHLDRSTSRIHKGHPLPEFSALDPDGEPVYSRDLIGRPALLMFYRGNWCPFCMLQIKELVAAYRDLGERAKIVLISPQPAGHTKKLANKFQVPFEFWVDPDGQVATVLGLHHENGLPAGMQVLGYDSDTVLPTVIVVGPDGTVLDSYESNNYRDRANPDFLTRTLEQHGL